MSSKAFFRAFYHAMLDDEDFQKLSADARWVLVCMRTSRICNMACMFICDEGTLVTIAEQTGLPLKRVKAVIFGELSDSHWIAYQKPILWVRNGLKYDPFINLANPKHKTGVENVLKSLPKKGIVLKYCDYYNLAYPFDRVSDGNQYPCESYNNKNSNINNNNNKNSTTSNGDKSPDSKSFKIEYEKIKNQFNAICVDLPKVKLLSQERKTKIKSIIKRLGWNKSNYLQNFENVFNDVHASGFLCGRTDKKNSWCGFDWIIKPANLLKIMEGNYTPKDERKKSEQYKKLNQQAVDNLRDRLLREE